MEHKTWLWKKRSTEKTMAAADKVNQEYEEEVQLLLADKAELERELKTVSWKLSSALAESSAKDDIAKKQTSIAREAIAGWEKAETDAIALKKELDKVIHQRVSDEERLIYLDAALKECMQQLRFVREEQEKRIHEAVMKTSREFENARSIFEEKLAETSKRLGIMGSENTQLSKALLAKEKMISDLEEQITRADANFSAVMSKLESIEKENASLNYEVRVLEKELEIRNEEREFNRRTADVAHKHHLDNVKKIAKLESECQRLRMLVRKRLPGPADLVKMKNEVEMLGKDSAEARRRMSNPFPSPSVHFSLDHSLDTTSKRMNFLTEQLCAIEEENRRLKESLDKKTSELQLSSIMYAHTASKLSQVEAQLEESFKGRAATGISNFRSLASSSNIGSDERVSVTGSMTPSSKSVGASDIGLMDDFVEMEKLAVVSVDMSEGSSSADLASITCPNVSERVEKNEKSGHFDSSDPLPVADVISSTEEISENFDSDLSRSIRRIMDLIEGIILSSQGYYSSEMSTGYMVRVFQWKTSELDHVLQHFLQICTSLLNGKAGMVKFAEELTSSLEWIMNHCFSIRDVSCMKDEIKKHLDDWDECRSDGEFEGGTTNYSSEAGKIHVSKEQSSGAWTVHNGLFRTENLRSSTADESRRIKSELANSEAAKKDLEERLQKQTAECQSLTFQLQEFEKSTERLQAEAEALRKSKEMMQDQVEDDNMLKDDLDKQLQIANTELNEVRQDLEIKNSCYEELEAAYLDQQLQLESVTKKDSEKHDLNQDDKQLNTDWEITAASEKLAECQETILNLGKQLKALASPKEASSISDKIVSTPTDATKITTIPDKILNHQRSSLLDKMMADDSTETVNLESPKTKEVISTSKHSNVRDDNSYSVFSPQKFLSLNGIKHQEEEEALVNFLSIVPSKTKDNGGLLKKLFSRRKKGSSKKMPFLLTSK